MLRTPILSCTSSLSIMLHHMMIPTVFTFTVDPVPRFRPYIPQLCAKLHRCALGLAVGTRPPLLRPGELAWGGHKGGARTILQETHAGNGGEPYREIDLKELHRNRLLCLILHGALSYILSLGRARQSSGSWRNFSASLYYIEQNYKQIATTEV